MNTGDKRAWLERHGKLTNGTTTDAGDWTVIWLTESTRNSYIIRGTAPEDIHDKVYDIIKHKLFARCA